MVVFLFTRKKVIFIHSSFTTSFFVINLHVRHKNIYFSLFIRKIPFASFFYVHKI